jgi:hypothetical protein
MSTTESVSMPNIPAGEYVYAEANCSTTLYQIATLHKLDSGVMTAKVQGNYGVLGTQNAYNDPGPIGLYNEETDTKLLKKYLNIQ